MVAQLLLGKQVSDGIEKSLKEIVQTKTALGHRAPHLAVILIGDNSASQIYVSRKKKVCEKLGITASLYSLPGHINQKNLLKLIKQLNQDNSVDGILIQMPLPAHINQQMVIEQINPHKDVDGFHPYNLGRLAQGHPTIRRPCTPYGIMQLLQHYSINLSGKHAVVLGASNIVGRPMAFELLLAKSTVTVCHSQTTDLVYHVRGADILISATGKKNIVDPTWIKFGAVVIDVGIHRLKDQSICGDLDTQAMMQIASFVTPVPGGVGPMTVATLMSNIVHTCYENIISN